MPDFGQIIMLVDVHAKLDFLQFRAGRFSILGVLGNIVSELSEIDDLADRRTGGGRDFHQVEPQTLSLAQGVVQPHDAELFAGGPKNDPNFASANAPVYTDLWLQIRSCS